MGLAIHTSELNPLFAELRRLQTDFLKITNCIFAHAQAGLCMVWSRSKVEPRTGMGYDPLRFSR